MFEYCAQCNRAHVMQRIPKSEVCQDLFAGKPFLIMYPTESSSGLYSSPRHLISHVVTKLVTPESELQYPTRTVLLIRTMYLYSNDVECFVI
ncbi:unnamed protein product [Larinioides sclopetarius]|uniref:Uncharacterized protein n=1 Tax=Larinioides sclopetarius TaxID=280406 RepID=A0AAV1Z2S8_9ARAC